MSWLGSAIVGSAVIGYQGQKKQSGAIESAADAQAAAEREKLAFQREMWEKQQEQYQPYYEAGTKALGEYAGLTPFQYSAQDLQQDPGYQFRLQQGQQMLERQLGNVPGGARSSRGMNEALRYGQGLASQEYGQAYNRALTQYSDQANRLAALAGIGQTATAGLSSAAGQAGQAIGGTLGQMGTTQANAMLAQGGLKSSMYTGIGDALTKGVNIYNQQQMMNQYQNPYQSMYSTPYAIPGGQGTMANPYVNPLTYAP